MIARLIGALAAVGLLYPALAAAAGTPTPEQEVAAIEQQTTRIRHLSMVHPVKAQFPTDGQFNKLLNANSRRVSTDAEIELAQRESVLVGFLKPTDDLHKILFGSLTDQVIGFYDYFNKALYLRQDKGRVFGPGRYNIAHEYTHALQDANYNLQKLLPDESVRKVRNSDAVGAHHALTEGDAVNTQNLFISRTYSEADINALIKMEENLPKTRPLPVSLQRQFDFAYTTGVSFVESLYKGGGMKAVNAAYKRLPSSTYEIMHPAAYKQGWKSTAVTLTGVRGFDTWNQMDDDVFGAQGYNLLIWQYHSVKFANRVTDQYRGDRYIFLENGTQNAMLMVSIWSSPSAATAARSALLGSLRARYTSSQTVPGAGTILVEKDGAVYFRVDGKRLVVAYAPSQALAQQLGQAPRT